jgi:hypothetical protein
MIARMMTMAVAATLVLGTATFPTVTFAEMLKKEETKKDTTKKKELTPQQQKMKDCAGKWNEEKKAKKVSGKKAHNEFMSGCLKG